MMYLLSSFVLKERISSISFTTASFSWAASSGSLSSRTCFSASTSPSGESTRNTWEVPPRPSNSSTE